MACLQLEGRGQISAPSEGLLEELLDVRIETFSEAHRRIQEPFDIVNVGEGALTHIKLEAGRNPPPARIGDTRRDDLHSCTFRAAVGKEFVAEVKQSLVPVGHIRVAEIGVLSGSRPGCAQRLGFQ